MALERSTDQERPLLPQRPTRGLARIVSFVLHPLRPTRDRFSSFLDDIDRITAPEYAPSDQDIVRARLRTTGVQEHHFKLDRGILSFVVVVPS